VRLRLAEQIGVLGQPAVGIPEIVDDHGEAGLVISQRHGDRTFPRHDKLLDQFLAPFCARQRLS
jgi:hypothetical protein